MKEDAMREVYDAIGQLDVDNNTHWIRDGRPSVDALSDIVGRPVKSQERDTAWLTWREHNGDPNGSIDPEDEGQGEYTEGDGDATYDSDTYEEIAPLRERGIVLTRVWRHRATREKFYEKEYASEHGKSPFEGWTE